MSAVLGRARAACLPGVRRDEADALAHPDLAAA